MSNKSKLYGAAVTTIMVTLMYFTVAGLMGSAAAGESAKPNAFTHAVFAELATATW